MCPSIFSLLKEAVPGALGRPFRLTGRDRAERSGALGSNRRAGRQRAGSRRQLYWTLAGCDGRAEQAA
jgi:hypothetical protein